MRETHYSPLEYRIAMLIFEDLNPELKKTMDCLLKEVCYNKPIEIQENYLRQLEDYRDDLGRTLYNIYYNAYLALYGHKSKPEQYELFEV